MEIAQLLDQFCEYSRFNRGYLPETINRYRTGLRVFCRATGVRVITDCTAELVRRFFHDGASSRNWNPATFRTYHNTLIVFFRWCASRGYLSANPAEGMDLPRLRKHLPQRLTAEESEQLLARIANYPYQRAYQRTRDHAMIATLLYAGLRRREVLRLQVRDLDTEHRTVFVRQGKGGKDRMVPMHWQLAATLSVFLEARRKAGKTCPEVFTSVQRDTGLTVNALRKVFQRIEQIAGRPLRAHQLRHTFATLMLEGGCDLFALSRMMGHSDIKTTAIYLSATVEHMRAQMAKHPLTYTER